MCVHVCVCVRECVSECVMFGKLSGRVGLKEIAHRIGSSVGRKTAGARTFGAARRLDKCPTHGADGAISRGFSPSLFTPGGGGKGVGGLWSRAAAFPRPLLEVALSHLPCATCPRHARVCV